MVGLAPGMGTGLLRQTALQYLDRPRHIGNVCQLDGQLWRTRQTAWESAGPRRGRAFGMWGLQTGRFETVALLPTPKPVQGSAGQTESMTWSYLGFHGSNPHSEDTFPWCTRSMEE